jgi:hypothetical protein
MAVNRGTFIPACIISKANEPKRAKLKLQTSKEIDEIFMEEEEEEEYDEADKYIERKRRRVEARLNKKGIKDQKIFDIRD